MAEFSNDIFFAGAAELNARLKTREFSCKELTKAFLDRLESRGPEYNALACLMRKRALDKAKNVDDEIKLGRDRGPLHGVPCGVKDLLAIEDYPTTWGAKPYADQIFDDTATAVRKLDGAGAIVIGKLSMVELAGGGGYNSPGASLQGPGLNPWDKTKWSGGSSSGPGSAVAAGLTTFALGSETSGSILTPSAFCGVTGLRPTYGYVSSYGAMTLSWTMDKIGPMARSAEDCGQVLQAISGGDSEDPLSSGKRFYYAPRFARDFKTLTIGYAPVDFDGWAAEETRPALHAAFDVLRGMGFEIKEVELPDFPYGPMTGTIIDAEGSAAFEKLIQSGDVEQLADRGQIAGLKAGLEIRANDYLRAMRIRRLMQEAFRELLVDISMLVTPTRMSTAPSAFEPFDASGPESPEPKSRGLRSIIPAGNLAGLPALSLPCGFAGGLPVGISLVGRPYYENTLLAVGNGFQSETDWHKRRPPV